ncbi:MAG: hypothetical protein MK102_14405 [Fuerstiella sp.]|nr:hypothetical protein [Fuerstiella sp.]
MKDTAFVCLLSILPNACLAQEPVHIGSQRQLFLDNFVISQIDDLQQRMHQPVKHGAVIEPDQPWETTLQIRCAPIWDKEKGVFKVWMITSTNIPDLAGTSYAESKDGLHWTRPTLGQTEINGSLENNFLSVVPGDSWPDNGIANVVYDPDDPDPNRRFKGFYGVINRRPMVSANGIDWTLLEADELPSQDESNLSYDPANRIFIATLKRRGPYGRSHGIWTSRDFTNWKDTGVLFHADELDQELGIKQMDARQADTRYQLQRPLWKISDTYKGKTAKPRVDVYNVGLFRYEEFYIGTPAMFHSNGNRWNKDGFHLIQLVAGRDLKTFNRLGDRHTFIGPSMLGTGAYDLTQLIGPTAPVVRGDELWFYYTGIKYRARPKDADKKAGTVCLAVLRRDGFVSLSAGQQPGKLITRQIISSGNRLRLNLAVHDGGQARVALIGDNNEPLPGYDLADCNPLREDDVNQTVSWKSGSDIQHITGQSIRLHIKIQDADLYAFQFTDGD